MMQALILSSLLLFSSAQRDAFDRAVTADERIEAGVLLLDDLLARQWSEALCVDGSIFGFRDADRDATASRIIGEAIEVSDLLAGDIHAQNFFEDSVEVDADRWQILTGIAYAADAAIRNHVERAGEAISLLDKTARRDMSGRSLRMLAVAHQVQGRYGVAKSLASEVLRNPEAAPLERAAAKAMLLRPEADPEGTLIAIAEASTPWEVTLLAETAAVRSESPLAWVGPMRQHLVRTGLDPLFAVDLASNLAARVQDQSPGFFNLDHAALLGQARAAAAEGKIGKAREWLEEGGERWPAPMEAERLVCLASITVNPVDRLAIDVQAAQAGGERRLRRWETVASAADVLLRGDPHHQLAHEALMSACDASGIPVRWTRVLAGHEAKAGRVEDAVGRLCQISPGGSEHLSALSQIAGMLDTRRLKAGQWAASDAATLRDARAAAMAAALQRHDIQRSTAAAPVAGKLTVCLMECLLDQGEIEQAEAILRERDVADWLEPQDRLRLEARWAAEASQSESLRRLLRAQDQETIQHLCRGLLAASRTWSERVQSVIFAALAKLTPQGSNDELVGIGNAFRLAGRCDNAVQWYEAALIEDPSLLEAVLGRSECLRGVDDRAALAIAADGFRRVAAMPRSEDPERWRSANLSLLEVLQRAGVDRSRIDARLERLRRIDPAIGGLPQS
ncbi:MAG: hypothetical protein MK100_05535 [Phycisphaerales bacterium]|nr:hypothetical protein [Phycisphaerales bacterium]